MLGAGVIFVVLVVVVIVVIAIIVVLVGFLGSGAILWLTLAVVAVALVAAIIGIAVVVITVLAVIGLARDLLDRPFVILVKRESRDAGQLAITHGGIQRPLPAASSTTADCYGLLVLRR